MSVGYEGRPSQTQVERTDALTRELADVVAQFDTWVAKELPGLNSALQGKKLAPIMVMTHDEWQKSTARQAATNPPQNERWAEHD